jgi:hypothetical protein
MTFFCIIKSISINVFRNFSNFNIVRFRKLKNFNFLWTSWFFNARFRILRFDLNILKEIKIGCVIIWIIDTLCKSWIELAFSIRHHYLLRLWIKVCIIVWANEYKSKCNSNISSKILIFSTEIVCVGST